jgi:hypothetical protein
VPSQGVEELVGNHVPQARGAIKTSAGQGAPVRAEHHSTDDVVVVVQGGEELVGGHVPQARGVIRAGGASICASGLNATP